MQISCQKNLFWLIYGKLKAQNTYTAVSDADVAGDVVVVVVRAVVLLHASYS